MLNFRGGSNFLVNLWLFGVLATCFFPKLSAAASDCYPTQITKIMTNDEGSGGSDEVGDCLPAGVVTAGGTNTSGQTTVSADQVVEEIVVVGSRNNSRNELFTQDLSQIRSGNAHPRYESSSVPLESTDDNASAACSGSSLDPKAGNPSSALSGEKLQWAMDYSSADRLPLVVAREYATSSRNEIDMFGRGWNPRGVGSLTTTPAPAQEGNWVKVSVGDSIASYLFDYNVDTGEIAHRSGYASQAMLHREIIKGNDFWVLVHPDGAYSLFSAEPGQYQGFLLSTYSNDGQFLRYVYHGIYNAIKYPLRIEHSTGAYAEFSYALKAGSYVVASMTNAMGDEWKYQYDTNGRLTSAYDPLGYRYQYRYDSNHRLTEVISKAGLTIGAWTYDSQNRTKTSSRHGGSQLVTFDYESHPIGVYQRIKVTDEFGRKTTYNSGLYNGRTYLMSTVQSADSTCPSSVEEADYYANTGLPYWVKTTAGLKTTYEYDDYFRPKSILLEDVSGGPFSIESRKFTKEYGLALPFLNKVTFSQGNTDIYREEYDYCLTNSTTCRVGLVLKEVRTDLRPNGTVREINYSYSFGPNGQMSRFTETGPRVNDRKEVTFDLGGREHQRFSNGRLISTINSYTLDGRPTSVTLPGLYTATFAYDKLGRIKESTRTASTDEHKYLYTYNMNGQLSGIVSPDEIGKVGVELRYNENGQLTQRRYTSPLPPPPPPPPPCIFPCSIEN